MRLERESRSEIQEDTAEYRTAIKSVIRCQIQSLLQKLAAETGEESILISTNLAAGTYNHLGSHLGQDYLEDGEDVVQVICEKFTSYCAEAQTQDSNSESSTQKCQSSPNTGASKYKSLPAPKRKRLFDTQESPNNPSPKRKPNQYSPEVNSSHGSSSHGSSSHSSFSHTSSSHTLNNSSHAENSPDKAGDLQGSDNLRDLLGNSRNENGENQSQGLTWIKTEPKEDDLNQDSINMTEQSQSQAELKSSDSNNYDDPSQTSIINRPKSLIPLANIYKKYGTSKPIKIESPVQCNTEEDNNADRSILRSLYEQPLYKIVDQMQEEAVRGADRQDRQSSSIALPTNVNDDSFNASSENLVLSGYYDSESYPLYRHKQKHPAANLQNQKKIKVRDKVILTEPLPDIDIHLRTFESGGRLVYACDVCNRELSHLTSYRRHMKLHTMERPHKCPVCSKGFIRKYHCIDHLNKHHKGVEFDPDTLKLTGSSIQDENQLQETTALMTSTPEPGEFVYTFDQSMMDNTSSPLLDTSDNDLAINPSHINQSASAMLSELAKSAAKSQMSTSLNLSPTKDDKILDRPSMADKIENSAFTPIKQDREVCLDNEMESEDTGITSQQSSDISSLSNQSDDSKLEQGTSQEEEEVTGTHDDIGSQNVLNGAQPSKGESKADIRKNEVSEGIKAIVEHLKTSSKNKRKRVPPKALTTDMVYSG